ncbi:MAG TPA: pyridoxamine 5'-phosphate oxidase [Ignavibacteriaceae bacterium]|nr:pyridoxamine 5'-phosphate oxidase [Ignavibacteriaceae bacterium]
MWRNSSLKELIENRVDENPFVQFSHWYNEILKADLIEPNAMILATATADAIPSVRTVLLKNFNENGFFFYTNYESRKAKDLIANPIAEVLFIWLELERQVRVSGKVEKVSQKESEDYFHSRPTNSQIGAWASKQSSIIPGRDYLQKKYNEYSEKFKDGKIPLPPFWGGFRLIPEKFEFWQGRESRLHDRILYRKSGTGWDIVRLSP